jgi:hypothetical protein
MPTFYRGDDRIEAESLAQAKGGLDCLARGRAEVERRRAARSAHVYDERTLECVHCRRPRVEILFDRLECTPPE